MVVLLVIVTVLVTLISIWYALYFKYERYLKQYPGPTPLPLIGHALHYGSVKKFLETSLELHNKYGSIVKVQIAFGPPLLEITDPQVIECLLGSTKILDKSDDYSFLHCWLGTGLLTSGPEKWKKHRKILTPAFHFQILEQFIDTFNFYSEILVDKMKRRVGEDATDIYPFITLCSLDIICATSMGTAVNAQKDATSKYVKKVQEMTYIVMDRMLSLTAASEFIYSLTSSYRAQEKAVKILHDYTNSVIASRKLELQGSEKTMEEDHGDLGIKKRNTFLDTLLKYKLDGGTITDDEIRQEVDTFMFEGHDTTSSALSFILYSLANNLEVQNKAVEELHFIFGDDKEKAATSKDLHEMKYLEMVIKESLRLYPPVPVYGRGLTQDTEFNGTILPKGVTLSVFAFGVHRRPDIYPEPEKFDPERFTQENQAKRSPYAYIPFSAGPRNCIEFLETSQEMHRKYGPIVKVQIGFLPPIILIADPQVLESLLGSTKILTKSQQYRYMHCWLGTGLLTSAATKWKKHRKILTPAFHFQILEQFIDTFNFYSEILVEKMKRHVGVTAFDVYPLITLCSLDIICASSMGTAVDALNDEASQYVISVKEISRIIMDRMISIIGAYDFTHSLTYNYSSQVKAVKVLHEYTNSVIASRKLELQAAKGVEADKTSVIGIKKRNTFLDTLLKFKLDGGDITDDEIRQEVDTFMFEGHDTTSSALSFILYSLANNSEIQQKTVEELRFIFKDDKNRAATSKDLNEMKYLEMVIKESLRLYPPVPIYSRGAEQDIEFDGGVLPKGVTVNAFAFIVHRNPEIYPEPEIFDPERFSLENQAKRSPYAYIPFSAGPRNCIGQRFAMLELKAITSKILRSFKLLPAPNHKLALHAQLILKSSSGIMIRLQERER